MSKTSPTPNLSRVDKQNCSGSSCSARLSLTVSTSGPNVTRIFPLGFVLSILLQGTETRVMAVTGGGFASRLFHVRNECEILQIGWNDFVDDAALSRRTRPEGIITIARQKRHCLCMPIRLRRTPNRPASLHVLCYTMCCKRQPGRDP